MLTRVRSKCTWPLRTLDEQWRVPRNSRTEPYFNAMVGASLDHARGRFEIAEAGYLETLRVLAAVNSGWRVFGDIDTLIVEWARNYLDLGRLMEAEVKARSATRGLYARTRYSAKTAVAVAVLAEVLLEQGRDEEARTLALTAINMHQWSCAQPDSTTLAAARDTLARILLLRGSVDEALAQYAAIEAALGADPELARRIYGTRVEWPLALVLGGQPRAAATRVQWMLPVTRARFGDGHRQALELEAVLALAHLALGEPGADRMLRAALLGIAALDGGTTRAGSDARSRDWRLRLYIERYLESALPSLTDTAALDESFRLMQLAQGRDVRRAISASSARAAARDPGLARLVREKQDADHAVAALLIGIRNMSTLPPAEHDSRTLAKLRAQLQSERERARVLGKEIATRFPEYAELVDPRPASIAQVRAALGAHEATLVLHVGASRVFLWAIPKTGSISHAVARAGAAEITDLVWRLRAGLDQPVRYIDELEPFDVDAGVTLFDAVLAPIAGGWREARHLVVVATGPLAAIPLAVVPMEMPTRIPGVADGFAAHRDVAWLARRHAISYLPSVDSLIMLRRHADATGPSEGFLGVADPVFSPVPRATTDAARATARGPVDGAIARRSMPQTRKLVRAGLAQLPPLPETADEVRAIARALGADVSRDLLLGVDASEQSLAKLDLDDRRVIVFATHGLVPGDLDGLTEPALALSTPQATGGDGDGLLTMGEILALRLDADWVVLSACNTAAARGAGAEAVSGLGRAFFYAGARALLVSNWAVETESAKALTTAMFEIQAADPRLSRGEAHQRAMLRLIDEGARRDAASGQVLFTYAHPVFWAPFSVFGEAGR